MLCYDSSNLCGNLLENLLEIYIQAKYWQRDLTLKETYDVW